MRFHGSICAIITPFATDAALDREACARLIDLHLAAGTHGLVVAGSTGESAALDDDELDALLALAVAKVAGRIPVIAGCGAAATHHALKRVRRAAALGADAALVVTPYYVRPTQEGLVRHYTALADDGGLPIILYNVPGRTGCDLLPETVARLAAHPMIAGVKEARAEPERMAALLALRSPSFAVLSGDDPTALRAMEAGADGVISVAANLAPRTFAALCEAAAARDEVEARRLDAALAAAYRVLGAEPNPIPAKWMLAERGLIGPTLRLPLTPLTPAHHAEARACLATLEALERGDAAARAA